MIRFFDMFASVSRLPAGIVYALALRLKTAHTAFVSATGAEKEAA